MKQSELKRWRDKWLTDEPWEYKKCNTLFYFNELFEWISTLKQTWIICFSSTGFVSGVAWESPYPNGVPQGGRLRLHHFPAGSHGALTVPAAPTRLGPHQPEPSVWASPHRLLHSYCRHALWARKLTLLPHRDPVWEAGRCCEVRAILNPYIFVSVYLMFT